MTQTLTSASRSLVLRFYVTSLTCPFSMWPTILRTQIEISTSIHFRFSSHALSMSFPSRPGHSHPRASKIYPEPRNIGPLAGPSMIPYPCLSFDSYHNQIKGLEASKTST